METSEQGKKMRGFIENFKGDLSKITVSSDKEKIRELDDKTLSDYLQHLNDDNNLTTELEEMQQIIIEELNKRKNEN
jgi:hypothetical protein